jgi:hypothetical protein
LLKDSVPCPIPNSEKTRAPRCFFTADITHHAPPFNHDVARFATVQPLSPIDVAQMTRFGVPRKASVNHEAPMGACVAPEPTEKPENRSPESGQVPCGVRLPKAFPGFFGWPRHSC